MLKLLRRGAPGLETLTLSPNWRPPQDALWVDLLSPTRAEEVAVEDALGLELPTREEMREIEPSSRLYKADGATYMTATLLARRGGDGRTDAPVTFVLAKGLLITIRYAELKAFDLFAERAHALGVASSSSCLFNLLDAVVERLADLLENTGEAV